MPAPRGRGRPRGAKAKASSRPTKRSASGLDADSDYDEAAEKPVPKKRKSGTAARPAPLPLPPRAPSQREGRGINLGLLDAPRAKRTPAEMAAERLIQTEILDNIERQRRSAIAELAAIDADHDEATAEEEMNAVFSVADLPDDDMDVDKEPANAEEKGVLEFTQEDFERIEDEDAYESVGEFEKPKPARKKAVPAAKKPKKAKVDKGDTRREVEAAAKVLAEERKGQVQAMVVKKKGIQNSDAAAANPKAGISKHFLVASKPPTYVSPPTSPKLGGLADGDAAGGRPEFRPSADVKRPKRINELISIGSSELDETPSKGPTKSEIPAGLKKLGFRATPKVRIPSLDKMPRLSLGASTPLAAVKSESSLGAFTPDSAQDMKGLPAFVGPTWDTHFLPGLYDAVDCSTDPMLLGAKGSSSGSADAAVADVQRVLDTVYPDNSYTVQWGDKICSRACDRLRDRRSRIGRTAVSATEAVFLSKQLGTAAEIKEYAKYAVRRDGPGFWKEPAPEIIVGKPIKPTGYLESPLMIATLTPFLKNVNVVIPDQAADGLFTASDLPRGLLAMAGGAVHHALLLYIATGVAPVLPEKPPNFSVETSGTQVAAIMKNIQRFTWSRWSSILTACGANLIASDGTLPNGVYATYQDDVYMPSSPIA
ncbi:hypothetical protein B0H10DRAFT_2428245 [Mycena sp. CBHHK59/15]|nr:hypothetical protein B0H10DRAFT_2428245 [Mycena sp. CBHHK59/15]